MGCPLHNNGVHLTSQAVRSKTPRTPKRNGGRGVLRIGLLTILSAPTGLDQ